jgi:hypothetical protein
MGRIVPPLVVKLFVGMIYADDALLEQALRRLEKRYGRRQATSPVFAFDGTRYYEKELGPGLKRTFVCFEKSILPERLVSIKHVTNALETRLACRCGDSRGDNCGEGRGHRRINIDPGYIHPAKVVLATTKDFAHRIYIKGGIYEEVTLRFFEGSFRPEAWTYPDFRREDHIALFNAWRFFCCAKRAPSGKKT